MQTIVNSSVSVVQTFTPPPADATALIQSVLDSKTDYGTVFIPAGVWAVSTLTMRSNITLLGERGTVLYLLGNGIGIDCVGINNFSIRDLKIVSSGAYYAGYNWPPSPIIDNGQVGIRVTNCYNFDISNVTITNLMGHGVKFEQSPGYTYPCGQFSGLDIRHCYYGLRATNQGEYGQFSQISLSNCVFGALVESGNVLCSNLKSTYCSIGIKVADGVNPGHGVFSCCESNHNYYNLTVANLSVGQTFNGCNFLGNQTGGNAGYIQIYNSRGVTISGGQIGSNILVTGGPLGGKCLLHGNLIRDDIPGLADPDDPSGLLLCKNNFTTDGMWSLNN